MQIVQIENVLCAVPIVSLNRHDFLRYIFASLRCAETEDIGCSRIRLVVFADCTHPTPSGGVESREFSFLIHSRNEANIIDEGVGIIWRGAATETLN